jgi:phosphoribosyl 1,2-cyclic phosphodiesterase
MCRRFTVPHDAVDPAGFVLHHQRGALGFLTDLGFVTKLVHERVRTVHTLVIETNHDEKLLQNDVKRPWAVKQRIMSRHGHLSNAAAGAVIADLLSANLRRSVLGHLSRDCNRPESCTGDRPGASPANRISKSFVRRNARSQSAIRSWLSAWVSRMR